MKTFSHGTLYQQPSAIAPSDANLYHQWGSLLTRNGLPMRSKQNRRAVAQSATNILQLAKGSYAPGAIAVVLFLLLCLDSGGFFARDACAIGGAAALATLAISLIGIRRRKSSRPQSGNMAPCLLVCVVGTLLLISSLAHGATLTGLSEALRWLSVASFALLAIMTSEIDRHLAHKGIAWSIVLLAVAGDLIAALEDDPGRLAFPLQYPNASGALFAAGALLACTSEDRRLRSLAVAPFYALLLTQSGGALLACALAAAVFTFPRLRPRVEGCGTSALVSVFGATLALIADACLTPPAGIAVTTLSVAVVWRFGTPWSSFCSGRWRFVATGAALALVVPATFLLQDRIAEASQTLIERFIQMSDGLALLGANPLLGIGPDQWQFAYQEIQSAQYQANVIHCSYIGLALDGGASAAIVWAAVLGLCLRLCWNARSGGAFAAVLLLALHEAIDFDIRFTALAALPLLITCSLATRPETSAHSASSRYIIFARCALSAFLLAGCISGLMLSSHLTSLKASLEKDYPITSHDVEAPLCENDLAVQDIYLQSLSRRGDYQSIFEWNQTHEPKTDAQLLISAEALFQLNNNEKAAQILLDGMEKRPFSRSLYQQALGLSSIYGVAPAEQEAMNDLVASMNDAISTGNAALLDNQKPLDLKD